MDDGSPREDESTVDDGSPREDAITETVAVDRRAKDGNRPTSSPSEEGDNILSWVLEAALGPGDSMPRGNACTANSSSVCAAAAAAPSEASVAAGGESVISWVRDVLSGGDVSGVEPPPPVDKPRAFRWTKGWVGDLLSGGAPQPTAAAVDEATLQSREREAAAISRPAATSAPALACLPISSRGGVARPHAQEASSGRSAPAPPPSCRSYRQVYRASGSPGSEHSACRTQRDVEPAGLHSEVSPTLSVRSWFGDMAGLATPQPTERSAMTRIAELPEPAARESCKALPSAPAKPMRTLMPEGTGRVSHMPTSTSAISTSVAAAPPSATTLPLPARLPSPARLPAPSGPPGKGAASREPAQVALAEILAEIPSRSTPVRSRAPSAPRTPPQPSPSLRPVTPPPPATPPLAAPLSSLSAAVHAACHAEVLLQPTAPARHVEPRPKPVPRAPPPPEVTYYFSDASRVTQGPYGADVIAALFAAGVVTEDTLCCKADGSSSTWTPLHEDAKLLRHCATHALFDPSASPPGQLPNLPMSQLTSISGPSGLSETAILSAFRTPRGRAALVYTSPGSASTGHEPVPFPSPRSQRPSSNAYRTSAVPTQSLAVGPTVRRVSRVKSYWHEQEQQAVAERERLAEQDAARQRVRERLGATAPAGPTELAEDGGLVGWFKDWLLPGETRAAPVAQTAAASDTPTWAIRKVGTEMEVRSRRVDHRSPDIRQHL